MDLYGPIRLKSLGGNIYVFVFVEDIIDLPECSLLKIKYILLKCVAEYCR